MEGYREEGLSAPLKDRLCIEEGVVHRCFCDPQGRGLTAGAHACGARGAHYKDIARYVDSAPVPPYCQDSLHKNSVH